MPCVCLSVYQYSSFSYVYLYACVCVCLCVCVCAFEQSVIGAAGEAETAYPRLTPGKFRALRPYAYCCCRDCLCGAHCVAALLVWVFFYVCVYVCVCLAQRVRCWQPSASAAAAHGFWAKVGQYIWRLTQTRRHREPKTKPELTIFS